MGKEICVTYISWDPVGTPTGTRVYSEIRTEVFIAIHLLAIHPCMFFNDYFLFYAIINLIYFVFLNEEKEKNSFFVTRRGIQSI